MATTELCTRGGSTTRARIKRILGSQKDGTAHSEKCSGCNTLFEGQILRGRIFIKPENQLCEEDRLRQANGHSNSSN